MQITFYDKNMHETAVADNALLNAIKINKASLTSFFEEATHQVEFEFSKESGEWWGIKENGYLAFRFLGEFFRFSIVKFKENAKSKTISIIGDYFNLEMLSENCLAYENQPARTIVEHLTAMEFFPYANFEIGVNELATSKKILKYEGEDVKYKRLISIINNFGGECEFEIKQKRNGQFDKLILNIYRANDGVNYQGVGRNRRDFEITIDNSNDVSRTFDMTDIKTAIEPIGKDGLRLGNRGTVWKNEQGQTEFYQKNNRIYAPIAAENMPKVLDIDDYLLWKLNIDTDDVAKLESEGLKWLKNVCYGKETIEVSGSFDVRVGDTVILNHKGIGRYGILGSLRVMKITWNLLTGTNEVTFSNFKRLASKISAQGLALQDTIESPASYDIAFNTTAGTVFKNNTGVSTVSFNFFKNGTQTAVFGQRWYNGTQLLSNGLEVTIKPDMLTDGKLNLRLEVDVTDAITFSKELTFINVNDGINGSNGRGITSTEDYYLVSASKTGITSATIGWVKSTPQVATATNKYHWHYHVDIYSDGTRRETVPAVIGIYGDQGVPGTPGADGKTPYWHTAYANSADGKTDFSLTDSTNKRFIGQYTDYTQADSTDPTKYKWVNMVGSVQVSDRNYILDSNQSIIVANNTTSQVKYFSVSDDAVSNINLARKLIIGVTLGGTISAGLNNRYGMEVTLNLSDGKRYYCGVWNNMTSKISKKYSTFILPDGLDVVSVQTVGIYAQAVGDISVMRPQLNLYDTKVDWSPAPEDVDAKIDTKADQDLTQAQMLALEERSALARDNAIAEAMKNTISEVEAKWQTWYNLNTADEKQKVANDIASLFERVAEFKENLGEASAKFSFINNETLIGEEGVAIGDKEGKAKLFLSNDSISFVTNGVAQMTLTGDTLTIKNGLFTERIQIGNYVEEVYDRNPLYNVIRPIKYS